MPELDMPAPADSGMRNVAAIEEIERLAVAGAREDLRAVITVWATQFDDGAEWVIAAARRRLEGRLWSDGDPDAPTNPLIMLRDCCPDTFGIDGEGFCPACGDFIDVPDPWEHATELATDPAFDTVLDAEITKALAQHTTADAKAIGLLGTATAVLGGGVALLIAGGRPAHAQTGILAIAAIGLVLAAIAALVVVIWPRLRGNVGFPVYARYARAANLDEVVAILTELAHDATRCRARKVNGLVQLSKTAWTKNMWIRIGEVLFVAGLATAAATAAVATMAGW